AGDVDQRVHRQLAGDEPRGVDRVAALGDDRLPVRRIGPVDRRGNHLLVRRAAIGQEVDRAVDDAERLVGGGVAWIQRTYRRVELRRQRIAEVLHEQLDAPVRALYPGHTAS